MEINTEQIFSVMLGTDNTERLKVEESLEKLAIESTESLTYKLLEALSSNNDNYIELGSLLLHKKILSKNEAFKKLTPEAIQAILEKVVETINEQRKYTYLKRAAEIIVQLYVNQDAYQGFFELIQKYENTEHEKIKQFILYSLELLAEFSFEQELLVQNSDHFTKYFEKYMSDPLVNVRVSATTSLVAFLSCIQETKDVMKFEQVLPNLISLLIEAVKDDEDKGLKMIKSLEELITAHPKFVKKSLEELINVFTEIFSAPTLTEGLRNSAVLALATLSAKNPVPCRKSKTLAEKTIPALMNCMTEQGDDIEQWLQEVEENSLEKNSVQANVIESLPRFAEALGVKFLLPKFIAYAFQFINNEDWKYKYAGLMAIAMLVEGSNKHFDKDFDSLMKLFLPTLEHPHVKVTYAALTCAALLCDEFTPRLQTNYHEAVMKSILTIMESSPHLKIKARAVSSTINFCRDLLTHETEKKVLENYSDKLMENLVKLFELGISNQYFPLIEEILSLLGILAESLGDKFAMYYSTFMPGCKNLLNTLGTDTCDLMNLRQLTITTIGHLMGSFKENTQPIEQDLQEVMTALIGLQSTLAEDDMQHKAIIEVYATLCNSLKEKFLAFVPSVINYIVECANTDIKVHMEDEGVTQNPDYRTSNYHQMVVDLKIFGGKKVISLNHSLLEKKIAGFDTLFQLLKVQKKHMFEYLGVIAPIVKNNLDNKYSGMIRKLGMQCLYYIMLACNEQQQMAQIFNDFAPIIIEKANQYLTLENEEESHTILKKLLKSAKMIKSPLI